MTKKTKDIVKFQYDHIFNLISVIFKFNEKKYGNFVKDTIKILLEFEKNGETIIDVDNSLEYQNKTPLREWCDNQSKRFDDKNFSDLFYEQLESTSRKLSTFSKKIGKNIEDLEIDDLVLLVEKC